MEDQEQLLKDFVASAQKYGYDYHVIMPKFPEFEGYDVEMLKGYVSKVEEMNQGSDVYDYTEANSAFPDLFPQKKKDQTEAPSPLCGIYCSFGDAEWRFGFSRHQNKSNS